MLYCFLYAIGVVMYGFLCAIYVLARRAAVYLAVIALGIISFILFTWLEWKILTLLVSLFFSLF